MAWDKVEALNESFILGLTNCAWGLDNSIIIPNIGGQRSVISFRQPVVNYAGVEITIRAQNANGALVNLELLSDINNPDGGQKAYISGATAFPQTTYIHKFPYCGDIEGIGVLSIGFGIGPVEILSIKFLRPTAKIVTNIDATKITPAFPAPWAFDGTQNAWVRNYAQGTGGDSFSFTFVRNSGYYAHMKIVIGTFGVFKDYQVRFQQNLITSTTPVMELYWDTNDTSEATTQNITFEVTTTQFAYVSVFLDSAYFPALPSAFGYAGPSAVSSNPAPQLSQIGTAALHSDSEYLHVVNNLSEVNAAAARGNLGLGSFATVNVTGAALAGLTSLSAQILTALVTLNVSGANLYGLADILEQRNGPNAQALRIYGSYTDAANYERLNISTVAGNTTSIIQESLGTGGARGLRIGTSGAGNMFFRVNGTDQWSLSSSALAPLTTNAQDIGQSALTVRNIYFGTQALGLDGSSTNPAFGFANETNTGLYRVGTARMGVSVTGQVVTAFATGGIVFSNTASLNWTSGNTSAAVDLSMFRDAAGILAQRNAANAQTFRVYNTYTDASNYERGMVGFGGAANVFTLGTENLGTGSARSVRIRVAGTDTFQFQLSGMVAVTDNTFDIGATGATRPRSLYWGTQALGPDGTAANPGYSFASETGLGIRRRTASTISYVIGAVEVAQMTGVRFAAVAQFGLSSGDLATISPDVMLNRDGANLLGLRNSTNAQAMLIYNTFTDASNYERLFVGFSGNVTSILQGSLGTGTARDMAIGTTGASNLFMQVGGTNRVKFTTAAILPTVDSAIDLGDSTTPLRFRQVNALVYLAQSVAGIPTAGGNLGAGQFQVFKDTSGGSVKIYYNDAGTMKSVALI